MTEDLSWWEWINLNLTMSDFESKLHNSAAFRTKVSQALGAKESKYRQMNQEKID